jgi:hypothetical protein
MKHAIEFFKEKEILLDILTVLLIIINGTLVVIGVYPSWIGWFNYLFAIMPLLLLFIKKPSSQLRNDGQTHTLKPTQVF